MIKIYMNRDNKSKLQKNVNMEKCTNWFTGLIKNINF